MTMLITSLHKTLSAEHDPHQCPHSATLKCALTFPNNKQRDLTGGPRAREVVLDPYVCPGKGCFTKSNQTVRTPKPAARQGLRSRPVGRSASASPHSGLLQVDERS